MLMNAKNIYKMPKYLKEAIMQLIVQTRTILPFRLYKVANKSIKIRHLEEG